MKQQNYTTTILTADEGYVLTEVADVPIESRTLADTIAIGAADSPANYHEIPQAEADALAQQQREAIEAHMAEMREAESE